MSLASETRRAVADHPFLITALRAGVVNYTAGARFLDIEGETNAVATALRRYAEELPEYEPSSSDVRVTMKSGVGPIEDVADDEATGDKTYEADWPLVVGGSTFGPDGDGYTAIMASGAVGPSSLAAGLEALAHKEINVSGAGMNRETMVVVVDRLDGANAVRALERVLEAE